MVAKASKAASRVYHASIQVSIATHVCQRALVQPGLGSWIRLVAGPLHEVARLAVLALPLCQL